MCTWRVLCSGVELREVWYRYASRLLPGTFPEASSLELEICPFE